MNATSITSSRTTGASLMRQALVLASLLLSSSASAIELAGPVRQAGNVGIGLGGGTAVSGLSGKYFLSDAFALQAVVGGGGYYHNGYRYRDGRRDYYGSTSLGVNFDVLWELPTIATAGDVFELGWAAGVGGWTWIGDPFWLGANGIVGLEFNFIPIPLDIVLEYQPSIRLVPGVGFAPIGFGGHIRIYFT